MANKSVRKSQLIAFNNAAAGHDGVLSSHTGDVIVKPCNQSEVDFYESARNHPEFSLYIPAYFGTLTIGENQSVQAAGTIVLPAQTSSDATSTATCGTEPVIQNPWTPSNGGKIQTDLAVVLENIVDEFKKPSILDVKLGARLWADDAPVTKRARLDKAAEETTSRPLGFRIAGMRSFQGEVSESRAGLDANGYKIVDKTYGRAFNVDNVHQGFEDYFLLPRGSKAVGRLRKVMRRFVDDLKGMAEAIEHEESRMYSASLLFVYEGDGQALENAFRREKEILDSLEHEPEPGPTSGRASEGGQSTMMEEDLHADGGALEKVKFPAIQSLKLIDFAHAKWTPGQGPDENILIGIRNVAKMIADLAG